nr:hypothetical protein [Tanacetum cinerariifolium]
EPSDAGSPRVIVYGYKGLPMHLVDPYVEAALQAPEQAPPSLDYVPGLEHPPLPDYVPETDNYEEPSDAGSPRVIVYGYKGLPMHLVDPYVEAALQAPEQAPPSLDYVPGLEHPPLPDYVPETEYAEYLV